MGARLTPRRDRPEPLGHPFPLARLLAFLRHLAGALGG